MNATDLQFYKKSQLIELYQKKDAELQQIKNECVNIQRAFSAKKNAQLRPDGPAPMIATFSSK